MTLAIATVTSSGIILSADSRQTFKNHAGVSRIGSDSAMKLFQLNDRTGVVISGRAFLPSGTGHHKNTGYFIDEFRQKKLQPEWDTKKITEELESYLGSLFVEKDMAALAEQIKDVVQKEGGKDLVFKMRDGLSLPYSYKMSDGTPREGAYFIDTITFIVAGIDTDGVGRSYTATVSNGVGTPTSTQNGGAAWIGQTDVVTRIVRGWAPEVWNLSSITSAGKQTGDDLNKLEYLINWGTMTLQDAADFCVLVTRTTENIQRFSDGTILQPGGVTGVGGEIDVAAITPEKGFCWLKRKMLVVSAEHTDLDSKPNLPEKGHP